MLTISTLPEAIGILSEKTGHAWSESEFFDAATWLRVHLHAPVPETYKTTVLSMKPGEILEEKYCLGPGHSLLAVLFPIHVARLLISGAATTWHPHDGDLQADERKFLTEGLLVTRGDVRVKAEALSKILEGWENVQKGLFWYACPKWMLPSVTRQSDPLPKDDALNLSAIYAGQEREKAAAGRYNLEEAAKLISLSGEASDEQMLAKFVAAAASGKLPTYMPGRSARNDYATKIGRFKQPDTFYDECFWDELNDWLKENEPRISFRFESPVAAIDPNAESAGAEAASQAADVSSGLEPPQNNWDEYAVRRLLSESREPGMTHAKLGEKYKVTRQRIGALLKSAAPAKTSPFSALSHKSRNK